MAKIPKYQISYTLNSTADGRLHVKYFSNKKDADKWLKDEEGKLYWHSFTETNPKSNKPLPIIEFEPDDSYTMKKGTLETHFETGMECMGLVFYEDGVYGEPNPDFDPSKPEDRSNFKFYKTYEGLTFIEHGHILQIEDGPKIGIMKDRDFARRDGYRLSVYPQGFNRSELIELFGQESVKATIWIKNEKTS